jgi:pilus assembly protein Flp/PilA
MTVFSKIFGGARRQLRNTVNEFGRDEDGATAIEYGLIASLIFLATIAAVKTFGTSTSGMYTTISDTITTE